MIFVHTFTNQPTMGIDITANNGEYSAYIGYGGMQRVRKSLIKATIKHLRSLRKPNLVVILKKWIPEPLSQQQMTRKLQEFKNLNVVGMISMTPYMGGIDYAAMKVDDVKLLIPDDLHGVYNFVNHSDCEGEWNGGIRNSVAKWLKTVLPYFTTERTTTDSTTSDSEEIDSEDAEYVEDLMNVFQEGVDNETPVIIS